MNMKKNIVAALMSMSIFGASAVCGAAPSSYTDYVDRDVYYTGAIIDCRGLGLSTAMSPVVEDLAGHKVYGNKNIIPEVVIKKGMVGYATSFNDVALARAGSNPIVLKAVAVTNHGMNPVIDEADAALMRFSTCRNNYFRDAAIVFVR